MAKLRDEVLKIRSKNAGPFWLTVDIFCGSPEAYRMVKSRLHTAQVAEAFALTTNQLKRFDIEDLSVVKFSLPRPAVQGSIEDRDMHGASYAALLGELEI